MKANNKVGIAVFTAIISMDAMALTFDYRHEMLDTPSANHADRILFYHRFDNGFGASLEAKWKQSGSDNTSNKPFHESITDGTEVTLSYLHQFNHLLGVEYGFNMISDSNSNNYRPYVRASADITDNIFVLIRYRPFNRRYSGRIGTDAPTSLSGNHLTGDIGVRLPAQFTIIYELEYQKNTKAGSFGYLSDSDNDMWVHDVRLEKRIGKNWNPYIQIANLAGSTMTNERQTRLRLGIQYNF